MSDLEFTVTAAALVREAAAQTEMAFAERGETVKITADITRRPSALVFLSWRDTAKIIAVRMISETAVSIGGTAVPISGERAQQGAAAAMMSAVGRALMA